MVWREQPLELNGNTLDMVSKSFHGPCIFSLALDLSHERDLPDLIASSFPFLYQLH